MGRSLVFATAFLLAAGCSQRASRGPAVREGDPLEVYEAVFRYRLAKRPADLRAYLSVEGKDPPADLLSRLRQDWPNLKPASEEPKEKGPHVYVEGLNWVDGDTAVLKAGHWSPSKFGGEGYFADHRVVRDKGRWVVESVANETMS